MLVRERAPRRRIRVTQPRSRTHACVWLFPVVAAPGCRYTLGNSGRLDKAQFDRFAQDYLVGHGGPSAGYSRPPYWGGADQLAPGYYPYQAPYQHEYTPPWRTPAPAYPPSPDKEFEAGRLFERYDKNQSGAIERGEFERMVTDLRHSGGRAAAPPVPPLAPRAPHVAARAAWESPYGAIGMYGGHLSTMDAFRARMSDMTALTASLMVKREQMMQQVRSRGDGRVVAVPSAHTQMSRVQGVTVPPPRVLAVSSHAAGKGAASQGARQGRTAGH